MKDMVIVGTALFAEVVRDYFHEYTDYRVHAFACHAQYKDSDDYCGLPVVTIEELDRHYPPGEVEVFVAIGYRKMNKLRQAGYSAFLAEALLNLCHENNVMFATIIDTPFCKSKSRIAA